MLFIHGGGYLVSSAREYGDTGPCENLASRGVIIAIIQYRLGIYGFFSTGDSVAPGNYGMWDQIAALKWVKDNIENFGGDHAKVTVFGESAGASSVSYLTYTPAAKGTLPHAEGTPCCHKLWLPVFCRAVPTIHSRKRICVLELGRHERRVSNGCDGASTRSEMHKPGFCRIHELLASTDHWSAATSSQYSTIFWYLVPCHSSGW